LRDLKQESPHENLLNTPCRWDPQQVPKANRCPSSIGLQRAEEFFARRRVERRPSLRPSAEGVRKHESCPQPGRPVYRRVWRRSRHRTSESSARRIGSSRHLPARSDLGLPFSSFYFELTKGQPRSNSTPYRLGVTGASPSPWGFKNETTILA